MSQVKAFSLGGLGAPCCCGGTPSPCTGPYPIPAGDLMMTVVPPDNINGYLAGLIVLNNPGLLGVTTEWDHCYCFSLCGPLSPVDGPCPGTGGSWISETYSLGCGGMSPPELLRGFGPGDCSISAITFTLSPISYSASPFQIVYQVTFGMVTTTYTITQ